MAGNTRGPAPEGKARAREYILAHLDETKVQQAIGAGVNETTIARVRARLIREGLLPASRKGAQSPAAEASTSPAELETAPTRPATPSKPLRGNPSGAFDHDAMVSLAAMVDEMVESGDDETIQKRLIKQCLTFAFNPTLHPDTRMSASQMWEKLRSRAQQRALGPGKPKTRADVIARYRDITAALPPDIVLEVINDLYTAKEPADEGKLPAVHAQAAPGDAGATPAL